jgi:murein tripeptide amidase MpaA
LLFFATLIEICIIFALQCNNNAMQSYFKAGWKSQKKSVDDGAKKYALNVFLHTVQQLRMHFF